jgi:hypothetical protein
MAAKMEPELASIIQSVNDLDKDTASRIAELIDFLRTRMIPQIPLNYIWQNQNYGRRGDRDVDPGDNYLGRSSADQSMLSAHSQSILGGMQTQIYQNQHQQQAAGRASQYLAHSFYTNILPLLDQIFPGNPGKYNPSLPADS